MTIGPAPMIRIELMSVRLGMRSFRSASARRSGRRGSGCPAGRARPRGGTAPRTPAGPCSAARNSSRRTARHASPRRSPAGSSRSTAKPWFIEVISTLPVVKSFDRMVGAMMALMHLAGLAAEREPEHLMAEADAEDRHARFDELLDHRHRVVAGGGRIARTVGQEHAVGLPRQHLLGGRRRRHHGEPAADARKLAQDVALEPIVDGDDMEARRALPPIALVPSATPSRPRCSSGRRSRPWRGRARPCPARRAASRFSASRSNAAVRVHARSPRSACPSRGSARVSARVSMPEMAMMPRAFSHASKSCAAR